MQEQPRGLWGHRDFRRFWAGQTIAVFGEQISYVALPLTAVLTLNATATQMGVLSFAGRLPWLAIGLFAGVWVDRMRRRPVMIVADLARAVLLIMIPVMAILDVLRIEALYLIAFAVGVLSVFFDVAYHSYLPSLVRREQLVDGNSKLQVSANVAGVAGPSTAGLIVQALTAPIAIVFHAVAFLISAACLSSIRTPEPPSRDRQQHQSFRRELSEGMRFVFASPVIRAIVAGGTVHNFFNAMLFAVFVLYVTRELGIEPYVLGVIFAAGSAGALLGALAAGRVARVFGIGRATIAGQCLTTAAGALYPLASGPSIVSVALLLTAQFVWSFTRPIMNINLTSVMQAITPDRILGRMTASRRFIMWGVMPLGGLAGGLLGEAIGLRATLVIVVCGELLSALVYVASPLRGMRSEGQAVFEHGG